MKKTLYILLAASLLSTLFFMHGCADASSWVGVYTHTDDKGSDCILIITQSEDTDGNEMLVFEIGKYIAGTSQAKNGVLTYELPDGKGVAKFALDITGYISVTYKGEESKYAPPVGKYIKTEG